MEKRKFLYYNLNKLNNDKLKIIEDYIKKNDIDFKENNNGFLLNLSHIDDIHIDFLYDLYNLKEKNLQYNKEIKFNGKKINKKEEKEIYLKYNMSNLEKIIFSYS